MNCKNCKSEFEKTRHGQKFCTPACRISWHNKKNCKIIKEARDAKAKQNP